MNYSDKNIVVLGCGSWGGTVAQLLAENEYKLKVWHKFPNELERMDKTRRHPFIPELVFSENIEFTGSNVYTCCADYFCSLFAVFSKQTCSHNPVKQRYSQAVQFLV